MGIEEQILELVKQANPANPVDYVHDIVRPLGIEKLNNALKTCSDCPISESGRRTLFRGRPNSSVMFISDMPDSAEAGGIMDKIIDAYHINKEELCWINTVNCVPCKTFETGKKIGRAPSSEELNNCHIFVDYAIRTVEPFMIILLGNVALNAMIPGQSVMKCHGQWMELKGIRTMPVYSPNFLVELKDKNSSDMLEQYEIDFSEDLRKAFCYIQDKYPDSNILLEHLDN